MENNNYSNVDIFVLLFSGSNTFLKRKLGENGRRAGMGRRRADVGRGSETRGRGVVVE